MHLLLLSYLQPNCTNITQGSRVSRQNHVLFCVRTGWRDIGQDADKTICLHSHRLVRSQILVDAGRRGGLGGSWNHFSLLGSGHGGGVGEGGERDGDWPR